MERIETENPGRKFKSRGAVRRASESNLNSGSAEIPLHFTSVSLHDTFGGSGFGFWRQIPREGSMSLQCP